MDTKEYNRRYYQKNKAKFKEASYRQKAKARDTIWNYLLEHPCVDCEETDPIVLQFDHVRGKKKFSISTAPERRLSTANIMAEIGKCEIRCANCHTRKTAKERGYWSDKLKVAHATST